MCVSDLLQYAVFPHDAGVFHQIYKLLFVFIALQYFVQCRILMENNSQKSKENTWKSKMYKMK